MYIMYRKTGFKRKFLRFLMYKYKLSSELFRKQTINMYLKGKKFLHTYLSSFLKKSDAKKIYITFQS